MSPFPIIEIHAESHEEFGYLLGKAIKKKIQIIVKKVLADAAKRNKITIKEILRRTDLYLPYAQRYFPQYVQEIRGIAKGANVSFEKIWAINIEEIVFDDFLEHCSTIVQKEGNGFTVFHNEDFEPIFKKHTVILKGSIKKTSFISLVFAGLVPGSSVSRNNFGLIQAIDSVHPKLTLTGIPKNILARAILEAETIEEAIHILNHPARASGYNHILLQGNKAVNIETSSTKVNVQEIKNVFIHTNHYLLGLKDRYPMPLSKERYKQLTKGMQNKIQSREKIIELLSAHKNPPICHHNLKDGITIASLAASTNNQTLLITSGNPCTNKYLPYSFIKE